MFYKFPTLAPHNQINFWLFPIKLLGYLVFSLIAGFLTLFRNNDKLLLLDNNLFYHSILPLKYCKWLKYLSHGTLLKTLVFAPLDLKLLFQVNDLNFGFNRYQNPLHNNNHNWNPWTSDSWNTLQYYKCIVGWADRGWPVGNGYRLSTN